MSPPTGPTGPVHAAFTTLYLEHWQAAVAGAHEVLGRESLAEDAAQAVFVRLWKNGRWWDLEDPEAYLWEAGRKEALDLLGRARDELSLDDLDHPLTAPRADPVDNVQAEDLLRRLEAELVEFPDQCRKVCRLKWSEELSHREVAGRLDIKPKAVGKQVARGRGKLTESGFKRYLSSIVDGGGEAFPPSIE